MSFSKAFAQGATFEVNDDARFGRILEACVWGAARMRIILDLQTVRHYKYVCKRMTRQSNPMTDHSFLREISMQYLATVKE